MITFATAMETGQSAIAHAEKARHRGKPVDRPNDLAWEFDARGFGDIAQRDEIDQRLRAGPRRARDMAAIRQDLAFDLFLQRCEAGLLQARLIGHAQADKAESDGAAQADGAIMGQWNGALEVSRLAKQAAQAGIAPLPVTLVRLEQGVACSQPVDQSSRQHAVAPGKAIPSPEGANPAVDQRAGGRGGDGPTPTLFIGLILIA